LRLNINRNIIHSTFFLAGGIENRNAVRNSQENNQMIYRNSAFPRREACGIRERGNTVPVTFAREDDLLTLAALEGGWRFRKRLTALGLLPGEPVRVIRNSGGGPIVIEVKDTRLAIGRGEAHKIMVREKRQGFSGV
jgi:ferrous iron transport protein A